MRGSFLIPLVLAFAPVAHAQTLSDGCPEEFDKCSVEFYAKQSFEVGPFVVTVEVAVENGTDEEEVTVKAHAGDAGTVKFSLVAGPNATEGRSYNVTIELEDAVAGLTWLVDPERAFGYVPEPGAARVETFGFRIDDDARPGRISADFAVGVDEDEHASLVAIDVVPSAQENARTDVTVENETPGPGLALLVAGGLVALSLRGGRKA